MDEQTKDFIDRAIVPALVERAERDVTVTTSRDVRQVVVLDHAQRGVRVHAVGCADIARERKRANTVWTVDVPQGDDVAQVVANDINAGFDESEPPAYTADQITVLPCARRG